MQLEEIKSKLKYYTSLMAQYLEKNKIKLEIDHNEKMKHTDIYEIKKENI